METVEILNTSLEEAKKNFLQIDCHVARFSRSVRDIIEDEITGRSDMAGVAMGRQGVTLDEVAEVNDYGEDLGIRVLISRELTIKDIVWILERVKKDIETNKLAINNLKEEGNGVLPERYPHPKCLGPVAAKGWIETVASVSN